MLEVAQIITRKPSINYSKCLREDATTEIDLERLHQQYEQYLSLVGEAVPHHHVIEQDPAHPDCVFVEDTCVVLDHEHVVVTRLGAASRRGEAGAVKALLEQYFHVIQMPEPGTLDGGDVLRVGQTLLVGLSSRTNQEGADFPATEATKHGIATRVTPLPAGLHFKSFCSLASEDLLVYDDKAGIDPAVFDGLGVKLLAVPETMGANVLALGQNKVLVSSEAPQTAALLRAEGLKVYEVEVSEIHKADGALTCPSVRIPKAGHWCT